MNKIMNKIVTLAVVAFGAAFSSCSNIPEDERLIFVEKTEIEIQKPESMSYSPTVLVEDFTGQKCTWCPEGTRLLTKMQETYGEDVIIPVAIHSGPLGFKGTSKAVGLMTELGEYYWNKNGFSDLTSQPTAVINRHITTDDRNQWEPTIIDELSGTRQVAMKAETTGSGREFSMLLKMQAKSNMNANLQLWLVENGIVATQTDGGVNNKEYVHNHVLREALNGNDGEAVSLTTDVQEKEFTFTIDEKYNAANCYVVAFIYTDAVEQAIRIPIKWAE